MSDPAITQAETEQNQAPVVDQTPAPVVAPVQAAPVADPNAGIQRRIDELTAQRYEEARRAASLAEQLAAAQAQMTEFMSRQMAAPVPAAPQAPENLDPQMAAYLEHMVQARLNPFVQQFAARTELLEKAAFSANIQAERAQVPPAAQAEFDATVKFWSNDPTLKNRFTPADARAYAIGKMYAAGQLTAAAPNPVAALNAYNQGAPAALPPAANPSFRPSGSQVEPDFDYADPQDNEKALQFLAAKIRKGN